jgi:3'-phosphoadenosine 5'-phosphosulfate sulfotransferase (PAPS reductase)/FAD synthetase
VTSLLSLTEREVEALPAEEVIRWAHAKFGDRLCLTCSWQKQSSVLVHMVAELGLEIDATSSNAASICRLRRRMEGKTDV